MAHPRVLLIWKFPPREQSTHLATKRALTYGRLVFILARSFCRAECLPAYTPILQTSLGFYTHQHNYITTQLHYNTLGFLIHETSVADLTNRSLIFIFMNHNLVRKLFRKFHWLHLYFQGAPTQIFSVARPLKQNFTQLTCDKFGNMRVLNAIQFKTSCLVSREKPFKLSSNARRLRCNVLYISLML